MVKKIDEPTASANDQAVQRPGTHDPRRKTSAGWLLTSSVPILDAYSRMQEVIDGAMDVSVVVVAARVFADEVDSLASGHGTERPKSAGEEDKVVTVPGEGTFTVRCNHLGLVELTAIRHIGGTGIMSGDRFAEKPETAVKLVVNAFAMPRTIGGVRREKGMPVSSGEPIAPTT